MLREGLVRSQSAKRGLNPYGRKTMAFCRLYVTAEVRQRAALVVVPNNRPRTTDQTYFTPCISLLINGEISNTQTPAPSNNQKLSVKPFSALSLIHISEPTRLLSISYA